MAATSNWNPDIGANLILYPNHNKTSHKTMLFFQTSLSSQCLTSTHLFKKFIPFYQRLILKHFFSYHSFLFTLPHTSYITPKPTTFKFLNRSSFPLHRSLFPLLVPRRWKRLFVFHDRQGCLCKCEELLHGIFPMAS